MVYLNPTGSTRVVFTLYEECVNRVDPFFTFKLMDKDTDEVVIFSSEDNSPIPYYWNSFTFSQNLSGSQYAYEIYETSTPNQLDLSLALGVVEKGLITVNITHSTVQSYTQSDDNTTSVYRGLNRI